MEMKKIIVFLIGSIVTACNPLSENGKIVAGQKITPLTRTWELAVDIGGIPKGLDSVSALECGECHVDFYREWSTSTHSKAWQDYQFQEEWKKNKKIFVCINCHTPLKEQQEFEVFGLIDGDHFQPHKRPNQKFDKNLQQESITCAVCHVRKGKIIGPFGNKKAPHAVIRDPDFLSEDLCKYCHQAIDMIRKDLICTFNTGTEWENSPYAKKNITCIDCHMPQVKRPLTPTSSRVRQNRRHLWRGSGIAKFKGEEQQALEFFRSGLELMLTPSKTQYLPEDEGTVTVTYINQRAGHNIPTGDPERFITITFQLTDESGIVMHQENIRIGQVWEWVPKAKRISDNSLKPLERRTIDIDFKLPPKTGRYQFTAVVENHRILEQYAKDMNLIGRYPLKAEVQRVNIPISVVQN
jgi:hypothetical protein